MKYREIRELYRQTGWEPIRQRGSHEIWGKEGEREVIAGDNSDDVPKGLQTYFLKRLGLK